MGRRGLPAKEINTEKMKKYLITLSTLLFITFSSIAQQKNNNSSLKNSAGETKANASEVSKTEGSNKVEIIDNGIKKYLKLTGEQYGNTELRGVTDGYKLGFIDSKNKLVIPTIYDVSSDSYCNDRLELCLLKKNGKKGIIDEYGNEILPFVFEDIISLSEMYNTLKSEGFISGFEAQLNGKWGIFDTFGNCIVTHQYDKMTQIECSTGNLFSVSKNGKTGLIDKFGNVVIPIIYDNSIIHLVSPYNDDKFQVLENGLEKIVDIKKNKIFKKGYYNLKSLSSSRFIVSISEMGNLGMIDEDENIMIPLEHEEIKPVQSERVGASSCFMIRKNGKLGIFDIALNKVVIEPKFDKIEHILGEYYKVSIGNKWGVSKYGEEILSPEYDEIMYVKDNILKIRKESVSNSYNFYKQKIIPQNEKKILKENYQSVEGYGASFQKYFVVKKNNGQYGLVDSDENIIIPFDLGYSSNIKIYSSDNNLLPITFIVERNGKYGLFDNKSKLPLTEIKYSKLRGVIDNINKGFVNGKMCLLKNGKEILSPEYDNIEFTGNGKAKLIKEGKVGIWDMNLEKFLLDLKYDYISNQPYYYAYYINGKAGLMREDSTNLLPCEYERIMDNYNIFTKSFAIKKNGKTGLFDTKTNKLVIPTEFETIDYLKNHFVKLFKDNKWAIKHLQYPNINTPFVYQDVSMIGDNLFLLDGKKYRFIKDKMIEISK
jgi:hypothetical protein